VSFSDGFPIIVAEFNVKRIKGLLETRTSADSNDAGSIP